MYTSIKLKFWFFRHYWWIVILSAVLAVATLLWNEQPLSTVATVVGSLLSLLYFLQKQKLEELQLFRSLFKEFNERYDALNERLARIVEASDSKLSNEERDVLAKYFNICGEEYFYFTKGYIDPLVWRAWHNGMKAAIFTSRIQSRWNEEKKSDFYYA